MRKFFRLSVLSLCVLMLFVGGCGDSADPLGTGIIQFYNVVDGQVITSVTIQPGSSLTLVVRVMNLRSDATLAPVIGEKITFTLLTPVNGGGLTVVNDRTAGNGRAMALYTAGNNFATDSVRATTSNGATTTITITKTGGIVGARISALAASSTTVAEGQTSIITATVTDGNNNPMMGEAVTFSIPTNDSGACFINAANSCVAGITANTDASGLAVAVYQGGSNSPNVDVYDTVRAALANGSTSLVVITRSAETPLSLAVAAAPASVSAGQVSIVTVTLTGDNKVGVTVTFTLPVNNSGATLSASTAITDGAGHAVVIYTAGANNPTLTVSDTVQAAVGTATSAAAITRTGSGATDYSITVSATPNPLSAVFGSSVIQATVKNNLGTAVSGVTVTFTESTGIGATVSPASSITDANGNAVTVFKGGGAALGTAGAVTASITLSGNTYTASVVLTNP